MRVLLQNTETNLYFVDRNQWTADLWKATDFETVEQAAQVYHLNNVAYAKIVVQPGLSLQALSDSKPPSLLQQLIEPTAA